MNVKTNFLASRAFYRLSTGRFFNKNKAITFIVACWNFMFVALKLRRLTNLFNAYQLTGLIAIAVVLITVVTLLLTGNFHYLN
jgi:low affinity Fe/Cu permease